MAEFGERFRVCAAGLVGLAAGRSEVLLGGVQIRRGWVVGQAGDGLQAGGAGVADDEAAGQAGARVGVAEPVAGLLGFGRRGVERAGAGGERLQGGAGLHGLRLGGVQVGEQAFVRVQRLEALQEHGGVVVGGELVLGALLGGLGGGHGPSEHGDLAGGGAGTGGEGGDVGGQGQRGQRGEPVAQRVAFAGEAAQLLVVAAQPLQVRPDPRVEGVQGGEPAGGGAFGRLVGVGEPGQPLAGEPGGLRGGLLLLDGALADAFVDVGVEELDEQVLAFARLGVQELGEPALRQHHALGEEPVLQPRDALHLAGDRGPPSATGRTTAASRSSSSADAGTDGSSSSSRASAVCTLPLASRLSARTTASLRPALSKTRATLAETADGARAWAMTFSLPQRGTVP
ncbi:hypothetical protein GCM10020001_094750 [Nonomuraea salmonea]